MMINIDGFTPTVDTHKLHRTYSFTNCAYCGVPMSIFDERYLFNNKPICRNCLLNMYERYRLSTIYFLRREDGNTWTYK